MFKDVVAHFKTGSSIVPSDFGSQAKYNFYTGLKRVVPEFFEKRGRETIFVGKVEDIMSIEHEVIELMKAKNILPTSTRTKVAEAVTDTRTDEEVAAWIDDVFSSLTMLSGAAAHLKIRSMIVAGTPGTGKSYEVQKAMMDRSKASKNFYYNIIKGTISPIALYMELYHARDGVLILDDCDEAFTENECLQLLKAATESSKHRPISYRKLSSALEEQGIPTTFEFNGCVVILTNTNLEEARKAKASHYEAIMSRAHYINAVLATEREKIIRIKHVIRTSDLLQNFLATNQHQKVVDFIDDNAHRCRELSIRTVVKIAELCAAFPDKWLTLARGTLLSK